MSSAPAPTQRTAGPRVVTMAEAAADWSQFDEIIDVRTSLEWEADRIPGAINAPVLSNDERVIVGTRYASSAFEAKKIGAALVARNIAIALETQFQDRPRDWRPLVYCWRGGNRSNALATVMHRIGWKTAVLEGGYTAYRRFVIEDLQQQVNRLRYVVICGVTGSGKTEFLRQLAQQGHQVIDLEGLAHHRGSLLGSEPEGDQPSQKAFESALWKALSGLRAERPVYLESESKKIGRLQVPDALMTVMRQSPCIELTPSFEDRVTFLCQDYQHFFDQPEQLKGQLWKLKALVGKDTLERWDAMIHRADWRSLVSALLAEHYDPTYHRSMRRNYEHYETAKRLQVHPGLVDTQAVPLATLAVDDVALTS